MSSFLYNLVLVVAYTAVLTYGFCMYATRKKAYYRPLMLLFAFYLLDSVIIYMTESIPWLAAWYNATFLSVPAIKTVIYLVTAYALLQTFDEFTGRRFSLPQAMVLVVLGLWYLFIPMLENGPIKVWLYYFVYQVFTFAFGLHSYRLLKNASLEESVRRELRLLMMLQMIFSICIVIEDSVVIFNVDIYSAARIFIHDRNTSEDILRLISSLVILRSFWKRSVRAETAGTTTPRARRRSACAGTRFCTAAAGGRGRFRGGSCVSEAALCPVAAFDGAGAGDLQSAAGGLQQPADQRPAVYLHRHRENPRAQHLPEMRRLQTLRVD